MNAEGTEVGLAAGAVEGRPGSCAVGLEVAATDSFFTVSVMTSNGWSPSGERVSIRRIFPSQMPRC